MVNHIYNKTMFTESVGLTLTPILLMNSIFSRQVKKMSRRSSMKTRQMVKW